MLERSWTLAGMVIDEISNYSCGGWHGEIPCTSAYTGYPLHIYWCLWYIITLSTKDAQERLLTLHWHSLSARVGRISLSLVAIKAASNFFMTECNLSLFRSPSTEDQQFLMLVWHSLSWCSTERIGIYFAYRCTQRFVEPQQWPN